MGERWVLDALTALPVPGAASETAEAAGLVFRVERWRDEAARQWCLSWVLRDDPDACVLWGRHVDPKQD